MTTAFYDVTVQYTGTKTYRIQIQDGEPAAALCYIAECFYHLDHDNNPIDETSDMQLVSITYGEDKQ